MYDCVADHHDELTFNEGEVLVVLGEEDADWWVSTAITMIIRKQLNTKCHLKSLEVSNTISHFF